MQSKTLIKYKTIKRKIDMDKKIELSQEQIEEIVDSSNMNLSEKQRNEMIANLRNRKKSPYTLILHSDIESLQALIDDGLDINETNFLALAIIYSDIDIVKLLIENSADVNIVVEDKPLLAFALMFGDIEIIKLLIECGADVNILYNNKPLVLKALIIGNNEVVKLLIENGANIEFQNNSSLLEQALLFSNTEITEICIGKGSKFSQHILFDVVKAKDGYIFGRKEIEIIIDIKKKLLFEFAGLEESLNSLIRRKESIISKIKTINEMKNSTNTINENIFVDKSIEKENNETSKHYQELNKLHKRLNRIKTNMTSMINRISDMQDKMTTLKIIDFIKSFIKYGGDINYRDENGSTALMLLSYFGYEDCVKLLIENGAEIDIQNSGIETPLLLAYENNHFNVVKLLIDSGANVNIIMDNDESFYKKAKYDNKHYEVLEWIENSPTYVKITHDPKELVKILSNFTIDKPIKYTTHTWDFGELKKEYGDFDGYMNAVKIQWDSIKDDLEKLSLNLYKKVYNFLWETNPNIAIGWSSMDGLKQWCDDGNNPFDFKNFKEIVFSFKTDIEIRKEDNLLENMFIQERKKLGRKFKVELIKLKGQTFYTDTEKFTNTIKTIFSQMSEETRYAYPNITVEVEGDSTKEFIEIKITQIDSQSQSSAEVMLEEIENGDFASIKENLTNLCDWSIESNFEDTSYRVNYLKSSNVKDIEKLEYKPSGFTHILRFYNK